MSEETIILGVGSRVKHPAYGDGVIIRLHLKAYDVCFFTYGGECAHYMPINFFMHVDLCFCNFYRISAKAKHTPNSFWAK